jgi:glycosyltransferase involved in cell wall biosynthesis
MRILLTHNRYQRPGGEDAVFAAEVRLLETQGHDVVRYEQSNDELRGNGMIGEITAGIKTVWSTKSFGEAKVLIAKEKPDVAHFHNTFPLISPAAYYACAEAGVPVVQTLHNYRLLCPAATFLREGKVCESCLGRSVAWPGVMHGCYRGSRPATAAVATMLATHRALGTWKTKVDAYIALTEFARRKFIQGGLPGERIFVKPNFLAGEFVPRTQPGDYALFVGRLSEEKGVRHLPSAWSILTQPIPLKIVGDGPQMEALSRTVATTSLKQIEMKGHQEAEGIRSLMSGARFLVFPSIWHEGFPMVIAESFASGVPVIASRLGSTAEIVQDGATGLHFESGDAADLAKKVEWAWNHPEEMARMGRAARAEYEAKYEASKNYEMLMEIYRRAIAIPGQQTRTKQQRLN